ncbi:MAG: ComEC/Rec2 family competence protein [Anaerolineae bacterium]|nr:ComEC/Rec2 family competence protein [Anaerolineae bacterium]
MTLVYMVVAWSAGIALASSSKPLGVGWPWLISAGAVSILLLRREALGRRVGLCLIALGAGVWRFESVQPHFTAADLITYNDRGSAEMVGVVIDDPDVHDNAIRLRVAVQSIRQGDLPTRVVRGLALVNAERSGSYAYGDKLSIRAEPLTPPTFDDFSYREYLARSGVYTFVMRAAIKVLAHDQGSPIRAALFDLRHRSHHLINRLLPSPQSALLAGILLGRDEDMPPDVSEAFNQTGTTHIIAISGANITIVAGILLAIGSRLADKRVAAALMIGGIGVYTVFVGASPSVVRAAIMGSLVIIAQRLGRPGDGLTMLGVSVWVMTALNPMTLFDVGLLLSCAATLGLILYTEPLSRLLARSLTHLFSVQTAGRVTPILSDAILMTVAAQITTLPIIFLAFGRLSALSFAVNMLVIPVQPPIMSLGILSVVTGAIWFPAGQVVAWLAAIPLTWSLAIIRAAAQLPGASGPIAIEPLHVAAYYAILLGATFVLSQPLEDRRAMIARLRKAAATPAVGALGAAVAGLLWAMVLTRPDGKLHVWFLAVGEGNAVLIQTPNGAHLLIDGGENPTRLRAALGDYLPFYKRHLDMLIVTQPRPAAITALPPLLERYTVKTVITNGQRAGNGPYRVLATTLAQAGAPVLAVTAGYQVQTSDGLTLAVLNPPQPPDARTGWDDAPLILRLTYGSASFLLMPELSERGMQAARQAADDWHATVIQLPSNGAAKANPTDWLDTLTPQAVVILAEPGDRTAQPADSVIQNLKDRGVPIYRTDTQGTVAVATDGAQLWISAAR